MPAAAMTRLKNHLECADDTAKSKLGHGKPRKCVLAN